MRSRPVTVKENPATAGELPGERNRIPDKQCRQLLVASFVRRRPFSDTMHRKGFSFMKKSALLLMIALFAVVCVAQGDRVPAYGNGPLKPGDALPILPKDQLRGDAFQYPYQVRAYELAAKIPNVICQLPCYCYCDRIGHSSLHTCFESTHGAHCGLCMKEVFYAYEQTALKKTPTQIRAGIIRGDWKAVDLDTAAKRD
jgi:hypothetical protein